MAKKGKYNDVNGPAFEEALLKKLARLIRAGKWAAVITEIEATVPADDLGNWLWDARRRGVLPVEAESLLARHIDRVSIDVVVAALMSDMHDGPQTVRGVPESAHLFFSSCFDADKAEYLRDNLALLPRPLQLSFWSRLTECAGWARLAKLSAMLPAPDDVVSDLRAPIADRVLSGEMANVDVRAALVGANIDPKMLYKALAARINEAGMLTMSSVGDALTYAPREAVEPLVAKLEFNVHPEWLGTWLQKRRDEGVDTSPQASLEIFRVLRTRLCDNNVTAPMAAVIARAYIAADKPVPNELLDIIEVRESAFVEEWWPIYRSLPHDGVKRVLERLRSDAQYASRTLPLRALLGPEAADEAIGATEAASKLGMSKLFIGLAGEAVVAPLIRRLNELTAALPAIDLKLAYSDHYVPFKTVVALRSVLAEALGRIGGEIPSSYDEYLMPTESVFGSHHHDHVETFFVQGWHSRSLLTALPAARVQKIVDAWTEFDAKRKQTIASLLRRRLPLTAD